MTNQEKSAYWADRQSEVFSGNWKQGHPFMCLWAWAITWWCVMNGLCSVFSILCPLYVFVKENAKMFNSVM